MTIERAKVVCANIGEVAPDHIAGAIKVIEAGKGAWMVVNDDALSCLICDLTAVNRDSRKPERSRMPGTLCGTKAPHGVFAGIFSALTGQLGCESLSIECYGKCHAKIC